MLNIYSGAFFAKITNSVELLTFLQEKVRPRCLTRLKIGFWLRVLHFFFLSGFSFTDTDDSQDSRGREGQSFIPLYHFHPLTNIDTFILQLCIWDDHHIFLIACVYQTATRSDLPPYGITIWLIDRWCNVCLFTWWTDTRFLLQRFDMGNRWIWACIDCHPCITSEPTNQLC